VRILRRPCGPVAGFDLDRFQPGRIYDVGIQLGGVLLAEKWAEPVADLASSSAGTGASTTTTRGVVLVIDDDAEIRGSIATLLLGDGYTVIVARHGKDGLDRLCDRRPDVILLDLDMPVMDGWEFCAEQHRLTDKGLASTPVLLCTASANARMHAAVLKAAAFIEKPFDLDVMLAAVRTLVRPATA